MLSIKNHLSIFILSFVFIANAQESTTPKAVLASSVIHLFIKTLKPLQKDITKLEIEYDVTDPTTMQTLAASNEVRAVFKKHGWSDDYYLKVAAITSAFTYLKMEKELDKMPKEQKDYMLQMMKTYNVSKKSQINPADLQVVETNFEVLNTYFENYKED